MAKEYKAGNILYRPNTETLRRMDALVEAGHYKSRADLVDGAVQRFLAWEEYMRVVTKQLKGIAQDEVFVQELASAILPLVKDKIIEKL
jgi:Arc/MetJ-type ribon-helix-helix transcriptional regulator